MGRRAARQQPPLTSRFAVQNPRAWITWLHPSSAVRHFRPTLSRELRRCPGNGPGRRLRVAGGPCHGGAAWAWGGPSPAGWWGVGGAGRPGAASRERLWRLEGPRAGGDQVRWGLGPAGLEGSGTRAWGEAPGQTRVRQPPPPAVPGAEAEVGPEEAEAWLFG